MRSDGPPDFSLSTQTANGVERTSRLFLADLGGSEKLTKSGAADDFRSLVVTSGGEEISRISWAEYYQHRARLQESLNINVGLYALQRCIEGLIRRDELRAQGKPAHVPFADSKLTMLLKDALLGGAKTTVLVCASLEPRNAVESIQVRTPPPCQCPPPCPSPLSTSPSTSPSISPRAVAPLRRGVRAHRDARQASGRRRGRP